MIKTIGLIAGIMLPLWNIPLIWRMEKRKSSQDVSLWWVIGVWVCMIFMLPSAFVSEDLVYRSYSLVNIIFFTIVMVEVVRFRKSKEATTYGAKRT